MAWAMCGNVLYRCCRYCRCDDCHRAMCCYFCGHVNCWFWSHWSKYRIIRSHHLYLVFPLTVLICSSRLRHIAFIWLKCLANIKRFLHEREKNAHHQQMGKSTICARHTHFTEKRKCAIYSQILRMSKYGCNGDENELSTCLQFGEECTSASAFNRFKSRTAKILSW